LQPGCLAITLTLLVLGMSVHSLGCWKRSSESLFMGFCLKRGWEGSR
jgi:hypothetical protein